MSSPTPSGRAESSMSDLDHAAYLLAMASRDIAALRGMRDDLSTFDDSIFGFHAQQAVEKCLKAWIAGLGGRYERTHDLADLVRVLTSLGADLAGVDPHPELTPFGVLFRYEEPDAGAEPMDRGGLIDDVDALAERAKLAIRAPGP